MATEFYKLDANRLSIPELWRLSSNWLLFVIVVVFKLLGRLEIKLTVPMLGDSHEISDAEISVEAGPRLGPHVRSLLDCRFRFLFNYALPTLEKNRLSFGKVYLSPDGKTIGVVQYASHGDDCDCCTTCFSLMTDDTRVITSGQKKSMNPVPDHDTRYYPRLSTVELVDTHMARLLELEQEGGDFRAMQPDAVREYIIQVEVEYMNYHIGRGVFVPMKEHEIAAVMLANTLGDKSPWKVEVGD